MKFLVVVALLALAVAEATHVPQHTLRKPRFIEGYLYKYNLELNVTSGVLGLSSQVSAAVLQAQVNIYALKDNEHILKITEIRASDSVAAIEHKYGYIDLKTDKDFQDMLTSTIKFKLENGKITSYSLSKDDDLRTEKIKRSILRSLEMEVTEDAMKKLEDNPGRPVSYNRTLYTEDGEHINSWTISVIPFSEFPSEKAVYNISRIDNFEGEWYPSHKTHYNFQKQGCSEVCRKAGEWKGNAFAAGCPVGHEPHQSPIKKSFNHEQTLSPVEGTDGTLAFDTITTVEVHFAKMYDQDMEVLIRYRLQRFEVNSEEKLDLESGQRTDVPKLDDWEFEINEREIDKRCSKYKPADEAVKASKDLLKSIASLIVKNEVDAPVGEKAMLLRDALARLKLEGFMRVAEDIKKRPNLESSSHEEKVKRQIWMDVLPVVGTEESVKFIVKYLQEHITDEKQDILVWEAKEILEALPQNIEKPNAVTITELEKLINNKDFLKKSHLLHSAAHLSLARVIGETCGNIPVLRSQEQKKSSWFSSFQRAAAPESRRGKEACPEVVKEIIKNIRDKLKKTDLPEEIAVYIEALTHTGMKEAVEVVSDYVYGTAVNVQTLTQRFIDFIKSIAIHALHNIAGKYPEDVLEVVLPVFFNETESHKIRNAAFGVIVRCQPPLDVLEKIAIHSWFEKSYEVGSFVTSTLETFGNSSLPCMQLVAHRIKTVLPHVKRFDVGMHHAKNYMWSYFDELREFGLESRLEYTPNNESFVPTTLYTSLSYSMDSLRDVIFQNSLNVEGLTHQKVWEQLIKYLNIESVEPIEKEEKIFGSYKKGMYYLHPRDVDDLRMTSYHRLFYRSSFYFLDKNSRRQAWKDFTDFVKAYLRKRETQYTGYIVKLFLPSYYHTISIARTLPYPVEFEMRQPVVFAVKVETPGNVILPPSSKYFDLQFQPSLYVSKLFTHQMKNIGDCKEVGVYHEHKVGMTYPFELKYNGLIFPNITLKYKVPAEHKKILYYVTESGTYAGKKELQKLPTTGSKRPIKTRENPFKIARDAHFVAIPSVHIDVHSEDTNLFTQRLPRNPTEALHIAVKRILNAGWRYKSVNISISKDQVGWKSDTEGTFSVRYSRKHVNASDDDILDVDWPKWLKPCEVTSVKNFTQIARQTSRFLNVLLPHVNHFWNISLEAQPLTNIAHLQMEFNHTYEKDLFAMHVEATSKTSQQNARYEFSLDHLMGFWNRPDELNYNKNSYGKQTAGFLTAINLPSPNVPTCPCQPWEKTEIALFGHLNYESNKKILEAELLGEVKDKHFLPATHEKCLSDVRDHNPLSEDCIKAIREYSLFNKLKLQILWDKDLLHKNVSLYARVLDAYLKHYFFEYMTLSASKTQQQRIFVEMDYIDKYVDEPVVDVEIKRPSETLNLRRVPVGPFQPLSSVYSVYETSLLQATNNTYPPSCVWSKKYVQTFDKVTYPFTPNSDCQYVLSTHCTRYKNFAVVIKGTKEIHIHVASSSAVLYPKSVQKPYRVRFNDEDYELREPHLFHERHDFYAYTEKIGGHIHIHVVATETGIHLVYDGENVKLQVSPRYKGELCGLCSEFDGETLREMRGIDRCLYTDPIDFAQSAMIQRGGSCVVKRTLGQRYCDYDVNTNWKTPAFREGAEPREPTLKRNLVVYKGNEVCFSVLPVPVCENEAEPTETGNQRVGFHCLPSRDLTAKKMVTEAKFRTLEEIERKSVDHVENVDIPKMC